MKFVNAALVLAFVPGIGVLGGCYRPACRSCHRPGEVIVVRRVAHAPTPGTTQAAPTQARQQADAPTEGAGAHFLRYFDVKDLDAGSGDLVLLGIRTQVMPETWEREPHAIMEYRNGILIVRAPVELLNATGAWLDDVRAGITRVREDLVERATTVSSRTEARVTHEKARTSLVVQIHSVAALTAGQAGDDLDIQLGGPHEKATRVLKGTGIPIDALLQGVRVLMEAESWPGSTDAILRTSGQYALVVKASPAFHETLDRHLTDLRQQFGAGLAETPPVKPPVRMQPPPEADPSQR